MTSNAIYFYRPGLLVSESAGEFNHYFFIIGGQLLKQGNNLSIHSGTSYIFAHYAPDKAAIQAIVSAFHRHGRAILQIAA